MNEILQEMLQNSIDELQNTTKMLSKQQEKQDLNNEKLLANSNALAEVTKNISFLLQSFEKKQDEMNKKIAEVNIPSEITIERHKSYSIDIPNAWVKFQWWTISVFEITIIILALFLYFQSDDLEVFRRIEKDHKEAVDVYRKAIVKEKLEDECKNKVKE